MVTVSMSLPSSAVPAVGFLGGGMMASALIGGFLKGKAVAISQISVAEPYEPLRQKHAKSGLHTSASNVDVARRSQMLPSPPTPHHLRVACRCACRLPTKAPLPAQRHCSRRRRRHRAPRAGGWGCARARGASRRRVQTAALTTTSTQMHPRRLRHRCPRPRSRARPSPRPRAAASAS